MDCQCTVENLHRGHEEILQSRQFDGPRNQNYVHTVDYDIHTTVIIMLTITPSGHYFSKCAIQVDRYNRFEMRETRVGHYRYHGMQNDDEPEVIMRDIAQQHVGIMRRDYDYSYAVKRPWIEYRELYDQKIVIQRWSHSYLDDDCMAHINSAPIHPSIAARIIEPNIFDKMLDAFYRLVNRFGIF